MQSKTLHKIAQIDERIKELYEMKDKLTKKLLTRSGKHELKSWIKLDGKLEKPYLRVTLTDNVAVFESKDVTYRATAFRRYESKVEYLKNEPKED